MADLGQKKRKWDDSGHVAPESLTTASKHSKAEGPAKDDSKVDTAKISEKIKSILAQSSAASASDLPRDIHDGTFVKDIPINDLKNRYVLTRGATQTDIQRETGADVTTRGMYYADPSAATTKDPPLYLHVSAPDQNSLDKAVAKIEELIEAAENPPPRLNQRPRREETRFEESVPVGMESMPYFNLRAKLVGPAGKNVKYIQEKTGCSVRLKGKGSGFYEQSTQLESEEPLFVHISSWVKDNLAEAKTLTEGLIESVRQEYNRFKESGGSYGRGGHGRSYGNYDAYGYGGYGGYSATPPPPGDAGSATGAAAYPGYDYSQYYAYYGQPYDPNYYYNYGDPSAQQAQQPQQPQQAEGEQPNAQQDTAGSTAPPPPPPPPAATSDESASTTVKAVTQEESSGKSDIAVPLLPSLPPPPPPPED